MKRLLISIALVLAAAAGQAAQANRLYWNVADAATPEGTVDFAYAVLCDGEDRARTYTVGETGASKVRANADARSTPAVASNIGGTGGIASAEPSSFVVLLYDAADKVVAVSEAVSRAALVKHVYVDMRTAGEGTPYVFSSFTKNDSIQVTPGTPFGPFTTAEEATNAANEAVLVPRDDVVEKLGAESLALATYCDMFTFKVVETEGGQWAVEAVLTPEAESNLVENASAATRQIPIGDIAAMTEEGKKNVTVEGCVPGFYYTLYGAQGLSALPMGDALPETAAAYGPVLCEPDKPVTFEAVEKPSETAGFFSIGVKETSDVNPPDRAIVVPAPVRIGPVE